MAKDERLWMRFPIDMHRDPKVSRLTDKEFRTFFEMNGEARLEGNDGAFTIEDAEFRWAADVLDALVRSHPTEPLVVKTADSYVLRRFARHQFTEADRERLAEISRRNGQKGGRPRTTETQKPKKTQSKPGGTQSKPESESESELDKDLDMTTTVSQSSHETYRANVTDSTDVHVDLLSLMKNIRQVCDIEVTADEADAYARHVLGKARKTVDNPDAYVTGSVRWEETTKWIEKHRK